MNANNLFSFRVTSYKNGTINWVCDDVAEFDNHDRAVESARYHAEYWKAFHPGATLEKTDNGAKLYFEELGDRFLHCYEVI